METPMNAYRPHERLKTMPKGKSRTLQSFAEESEMNNILAKYAKTGVITHLAKHGPNYPDLPTGLDFHSAMNLVVDAQTMFNELPSNIRSRFVNDPVQFLEFMTTAGNDAEMIELGLMEPPKPGPQTDPVPDPAPDPVPAAPETP